MLLVMFWNQFYVWYIGVFEEFFDSCWQFIIAIMCVFVGVSGP